MSTTDKIFERLNSIDNTLAAQHESLKDHMRRTAMLEENMKPIQRHVSMVDGAIKLIGVLSLLAVVVESIFHLIK